jgi:hypothetical protein
MTRQAPCRHPAHEFPSIFGMISRSFVSQAVPLLVAVLVAVGYGTSSDSSGCHQISLTKEKRA